MARAILKRTKVLLMDEVCLQPLSITATANTLHLGYSEVNANSVLLFCLVPFYSHLPSVDYATDELIGKTIRQYVICQQKY